MSASVVNSNASDQGSVEDDPETSLRACNTYVVAGVSPTVVNSDTPNEDSEVVRISLVRWEDLLPRSKNDLDTFGFHLNSILGFSWSLRDGDDGGVKDDGVIAG